MKSKLLTALILGCVFAGMGSSTVRAQEGKFTLGGYLDWTFTAYEGGVKPSTFDAFLLVKYIIAKQMRQLP